MADEDITLDGKPLQSLRVADLKAALEQRNLPKSGQKNTLIKRLKGALMLENLQKSSSSHSGLQPNSQIGEEMSQNSFIKQYLAKQQELLRQRLEREAQQEEEDEESPAGPEDDEDDQSEDDSSSFVPDKQHVSLPSQPSKTREEKRGGDAVMGHAMMACGANLGPSATLHPQESLEAPGAWMQRAAFLQGHKEPPAPSPPRAVASLSVRVLGQPDRQGLPPAVPRAQEKEGTAPSEPGSAHPVLHLSRSARVSAGSRAQEDDDEDDSGDDESDDDDDWGPGPGGARRGNRAPPQPQQMPPSAPSTAARSKRKLQPPQHIPPPQVHHTPMQLRHPTPPPSPPPDLFPLPDTPKQSPPDADNQEREGPGAARRPRVGSFPPSSLQRQESDSSSRSSSPEPPVKRKPGPLSLLVHKMEKEGAFTSSAGISGESAHSTAGPTSSGESPLKKLERKRLQEDKEMEEEKRLKEEKERERQGELERERRKIQEQEREKKRLEEEKERKRLEEEKEKERKRLEEEKQRQKEEREKERKRQEEETEKERKHQEEEKERLRKRQEEEKEKLRQHQEEEKRKEHQMQVKAHKGRVTVTAAEDSSSDSDDSSHSSQSSSSSQEKIHLSKPLKKAGQGQAAEEAKKTTLGKEADKSHLSKREVSEPSTAAVTEVEPDSESSVAQQPPSGAEPENSESCLEEVPMPLPLPLMVPAAYYYYHHQHQHLLHSSSYSSYKSCLDMPKCIAGT